MIDACEHYKPSTDPAARAYCERYSWLIPRSGDLCRACIAGALRIVGDTSGGTRPNPHARTTCEHWLGERPDLPHKGPCCVPQMCGAFGVPVPIPKRNCGQGLCKKFMPREEDQKTKESAE